MLSTNKPFYKNVDWAFLGFIVGATYVKLYIKLAVIIFYALYQLYKEYEFKKPVGITLFYFLILITGTASSLVQGAFSQQVYLYSYALGAVTWLCGGGISYFLYNGVRNIREERVIATIKAFFVLNLIVSLVALLRLIIMSKHLVPYWYWESTEYFGASTGDHIKGVFSNNSITNAMVNVLGAIFFIYNKKLRLALACILVCLLCTSNVTLFALVGMLVLLHLTLKDRIVRRYVRISVLIVLVMYPVLSPLNVKYINTTYSKGKDESVAVGLRQLDTNVIQSKPIVITDNELEKNYNKFVLAKSTKNYYHLKVNDSFLVDYADQLKYAIYNGEAIADKKSNVVVKQDFLKATIKSWYGKQLEQTPLSTYYRPIKLYSIIQTLVFLKSSVVNFFFGAGIGNFSSKLAIKTTGLNMQGTYALTNIYISPLFVQYHLYTIMYVHALPVSEHSTINMPYSVYNQVGGEYGFLGIFLFAFLYVGYVLWHWKRLGYSRYLLLAVLAFFGFEYWFEMLTLTVVFELLLFKDIYKPQEDAR